MDIFKSENYKKYAIRAAKDLKYGDDVIRKLQKAKNDIEVERIMVTARLKGMEEDMGTADA